MVSPTEAIEQLVARRMLDVGVSKLPPRVIEPPMHPYCLCTLDIYLLEDGPVEVWMSELVTTTCELCASLHRMVISRGPMFGTVI